MSAPLLALEKVEVTYHRVITAVQGVSLKVEPKQIVALLGTNGAGKTTTLRAVSGFLGLDDARVTDGTIAYAGERIENSAPHDVTRRGIVLVPERDKVFPNLTVAENLIANVPRRAPGTHAARGVDLAYEFFPRLADLRTREAGYLSGGERQMLAIAAALACGPELLLVDELSLGLAPLVVQELAKRLRAIRDELGITILVVEQNAPVALGIADWGYVMENGRVVLDGSADRLASHQDVREFYLGATGTTGAGARGTTGEGARRSYRDVKQYRRSRRWYG